MATVRAQQFHPMLGHCTDGTTILFCDGSTGVLRGAMDGWRLHFGDREVRCGHDAIRVAEENLSHDNSL